MARVMLFFLTELLSLVFVGSDPAVDHSIIHENVLFYKEGEISLSSSRWILTLVLDIEVYERFIEKLTSDLKIAKNLTIWMSKHYTLRKHAYLNILKILQPQKENFQIKNSDTFHISAQNIDCGYSLEPPR